MYAAESITFADSCVARGGLVTREIALYGYCVETLDSVRPFNVSATKVVCLVIGFALLGAVGVYHDRVFHPRADRIAEEFRSITTEELLSVRLLPDSNSTLVSQAVDIPLESVEEFLALLRSGRPTHPNHPTVEWACQLNVSTRRTEYAAHVSATANDGLLIFFNGGSWLRCDPLRAFLERITHSQRSAFHPNADHAHPLRP